jgi:tRNA(Ile)-lysidine synthase
VVKKVDAQITNKTESSLREQRYALLAQAAMEQELVHVVLGHTLDDQIETMLFRLFRGTSPSGLQCMEEIRGFEDKFLLRPMLSVTRQECVNYLSSIEICPRHDSSNDSLDYTRNYIRHQVIPAIEQRFPGFQNRLEQMRYLLSLDNSLLEQLTNEASLNIRDGDNSWLIGQLKSQPLSIQKRFIAQELINHDVEVSTKMVDAVHEIVCANKPRRISLNARWDIEVDNQQLSWLDKNLPPAINFSQPLKLPGINIVPSLDMALKVEEWSQDKPITFPPANAWQALVNLSDISVPLVLRTRQPGDIICPFGMETMVKLKKYLHTHKDNSPQELGPLVVICC